MVLLYMVCHGSHQYTPVMLAYIPAPWILWVRSSYFVISDHGRNILEYLRSSVATYITSFGDKHGNHSMSIQQLAYINLQVPLPEVN